VVEVGVAVGLGKFQSTGLDMTVTMSGCCGRERDGIYQDILTQYMAARNPWLEFRGQGYVQQQQLCSLVV
jgi:hypothetical protein